MMRLSSLPLDKSYHLIAGVVIFAVAQLVVDGWYALAVVVLAALVKEVRDRFYGGTVDKYDALATIGGGALGLLCQVRVFQ